MNKCLTTQQQKEEKIISKWRHSYAFQFHFLNSILYLLNEHSFFASSQLPLPYQFCTFELISIPHKQRMCKTCACVCLRRRSPRNCFSWQPMKWIYFIINLFGNGNISDCQKNRQANTEHTDKQFLPIGMEKNSAFCVPNTLPPEI